MALGIDIGGGGRWIRGLGEGGRGVMMMHYGVVGVK